MKRAVSLFLHLGGDLCSDHGILSHILLFSKKSDSQWLHICGIFKACHNVHIRDFLHSHVRLEVRVSVNALRWEHYPESHINGFINVGESIFVEWSKNKYLLILRNLCLPLTLLITHRLYLNLLNFLLQLRTLSLLIFNFSLQLANFKILSVKEQEGKFNIVKIKHEFQNSEDKKLG